MGLLRPVFSRFVALVPVVLGVTILVFALNAVALGDPARVAMGQRADAAALERLRRDYALDRPLPVRYMAWLGRLARGDLGESFREQRPVGEVIVERLRSEEHTSELQSRLHLVCRLLLEKKKKTKHV